MALSPLLASVDFELFDPLLAADLEAALSRGLAERVVFRSGTAPLEVLRQAIGEAIRDIEDHPRGKLFQRFLTRGPYWSRGRIPRSDADQCLPDVEVSAAITFIYSFMVNSFQGCLAEILALPACLDILREFPGPDAGQIYAGDSVRATGPSRAGRVKGADLHILRESEDGRGCITVLGVIEVKSYPRTWARLSAQLSGHLAAARRGVEVQGTHYGPGLVKVDRRPLRIAVVPAVWHLPRTFGFVEDDGRTVLRVDSSLPPPNGPTVKRMARHTWHVTLRWSREALAAAAYELTFWYMAKVGEVICASGVPKEWAPMTPAEAGRNAATMMLYYAILRARTRPEHQRVIALYNAYGFGFALGTSFRNRKGTREMLWPEDLREILASGRTKRGCRICR